MALNRFQKKGNFLIENGLTGIVGPIVVENRILWKHYGAWGKICKSMGGSGMEDVIFSELQTNLQKYFRGEFT